MVRGSFTKRARWRIAAIKSNPSAASRHLPYQGRLSVNKAPLIGELSAQLTEGLLLVKAMRQRARFPLRQTNHGKPCKKELPIKEDSLIQQPRTDGAVRRLSFLIPRTDFDDLRLGIYIFRQGAVGEFDADGADEKADDAADNSSLDRIEALGQGQEMTGKGAGSTDQ